MGHIIVHSGILQLTPLSRFVHNVAALHLTSSQSAQACSQHTLLGTAAALGRGRTGGALSAAGLLRDPAWSQSSADLALAEASLVQQAPCSDQGLDICSAAALLLSISKSRCALCFCSNVPDAVRTDV